MQINALMILVSYCCICCETLHVGGCPFREYIQNTRTCTSSFIFELQANSSANCSALYDDMVKCIKNITRTCLREYLSNTGIELHLNESSKKLRTKSYYCSNDIYDLDILSSLKKERFPCSEEFFMENPNCTARLRIKFKANRNDPTLCSEFIKTKSCIKSLMKKYCVLNERARGIMNHVLDDYNPFCKVSFINTRTAQFSPAETDRELTNEGLWLVNHEANSEEEPAHARNISGNCNISSQLNRTRACTTFFVQSYWNNPHGNCSKIFNEMLDCVKCVIRSCMKGYIADNELTIRLEKSVNTTRTEQIYCGEVIEVPSMMTSGSFRACDQKYSNIARDCLMKFYENLRINASNPNLCSDITRAKQCLKEAIKKFCIEVDVESFMVLEYMYIMDDYNPFCEKDASSAAADTNTTYFDPCFKSSQNFTRLTDVSRAQFNQNTNINLLLITITLFNIFLK